MRSVFAAAAVALATGLCVPAVAGASHAGGSGGPKDFAVGGGTTGDPSEPTGVQRIGFAATGGPTTFDPLGGIGGIGAIGGDPVTGHFRSGGEFDQMGVTSFQQEGPVTCLVVDDNQARLVYPNKTARPETNEAAEVLFFIEDNGPPVNGQPQDKIGFVLKEDETPDEDPPSEQDSECALPQAPPPMFTLRKGNITIHDAE